MIEDPAERIEALVDSYRHAKRLLVVSALITETVDTGRATQYRDGVLTRWNTFQKFYEQQELQQFLEDALETTAVPVGLGVFYVFRDPADQQDFLSARSRRAIDWTQISARLGLGGPPADRWEALYAEHKELLDAFGNVALSLGRLPADDEFGRSRRVGGQARVPKRALRAFVQGGGAKGLNLGRGCEAVWHWSAGEAAMGGAVRAAQGSAGGVLEIGARAWADAGAGRICSATANSWPPWARRSAE